MSIPKFITLPHNDQSTHSGKPRKYMYTYMHTNTGCVVSTRLLLPEFYFGLFQILNFMFVLSLLTVRMLRSQHQAELTIILCVQNVNKCMV